MERVFLDSSALAKRYITEPGTIAVLEVLAKANEILVSAICPVEVLSAANRLRREGKMKQAIYAKIKKSLGQDFEQLTVVEMDGAVIAESVRIVELLPIRTLDALQLSSALVSGTWNFITSDQRQLSAAKKLGLNVKVV